MTVEVLLQKPSFGGEQLDLTKAVDSVYQVDPGVRRNFVQRMEEAEQARVSSDASIAAIKTSDSPTRVEEVSASLHGGDQIIRGIGFLRSSEPVVSSKAVIPVKQSTTTDYTADSNVRHASAVDVTAKASPVGTDELVDTGLVRDGLLALRREFDSKISAVVNTTAEYSSPSGEVSQAGILLGLQMKLIEFSLFVDIAAKFVGQANHAADSLLKGQ